MPAQTVGARGIVSEHPIIKTIENAGKAFKDMGNLFNQTRQTRIYEKSVEYQHWSNRGQILLDTYDRVAEIIDPQLAATRFAPLFEDLMVSGGMDRALFKNLSKRVSNDNLNWRVIVGRMLTESYFDDREEGSRFDPAAATKIVDDEVKRKREAAALQATAGEALTTVAAPSEEESLGILETAREQPSPREPGVTPTGEAIFRRETRAGVSPFSPETFGAGPPPGPSPPYKLRGSALTPELMPGYEEGKQLTGELFARGQAQFQQRYGFALTLDNMPRLRKGILEGSIDPKIIFPELESTWSPRHEATLRLLLGGLEKNSPQTMIKGINVWAKLMYAEATP